MPEELLRQGWPALVVVKVPVLKVGNSDVCTAPAAPQGSSDRVPDLTVEAVDGDVILQSQGSQERPQHVLGDARDVCDRRRGPSTSSATHRTCVIASPRSVARLRAAHSELRYSRPSRISSTRRTCARRSEPSICPTAIQACTASAPQPSGAGMA
mmetsp:Transcript_10403/g.31336  ORF Transcript_10403/g.31336 Transcript_10403/m.31336 type:complete len:155 (+) Transcript_10403:347-811(+)